MKKKVKSTKHSINRLNEPKERHPVRSDEDWHHIAKMLKETTTDSIEEFLINIDMPFTTFYEAVRRYDYLAEAHVVAKAKIGLKHEKTCRDKFLSMNTVIAQSLPDYLDRWKKNIEWRNELKENVASKINNFIPPNPNDLDFK